MWEESSDNKVIFRKVALIGTGLIGGSIGMALREKGLAGEITGFDRDEATCRKAVQRKAVDLAVESPSEAVQDADLVILAVPVISAVEVLREIIPAISSGAIITDVGSTKSAIMATVEQILPAGVSFIGGHPMAGSEESGIESADPALLENAIYVLTPAPGTSEQAVGRLSVLIESIGAQPIVLDPLKHDRIVAMVSHLPHIAAASLVQSVAVTEDVELVRTLAAGGFRDSTRIALGDPEVWRDICISNRWALLAALKSFKASIDKLEKYLAEPNAEGIQEYLLQARDYRSSIPYRGRSILPEIYTLVVLVRDTPGILARVTGILGDAGINIDAIEIMHIRELSGGSIKLGFKTRDQQQKALQLLTEEGYYVSCPED
ncbi:MAG: prephenate dehydrogenase [Bacillota bacterium]|nr:prephenate dehydrogenase [Bacillota bacterium]